MYDVSIGRNEKSGLGIYINDYKGGAIKIFTVGISFAENFNVFSKRTDSAFHKLSIGIAVEYNRLQYSFKGITLGDMINPRYGFVYMTQENKPGSLNKGFINFSTGLWYQNPYFFLGFSSHNITQPDVALYSVSKIPLEFDLSIGGNLKLSKQFIIHPSFHAIIIDGYKGILNSYTPIIMCSHKKKYHAGISYLDLNKIGIHLGYTVAGHLSLFASCAFSTNTDLYQFGNLSYLGGKIQFNF